MTNYLLDTHIFLWYISGNSRLPDRWRDEISNSHNNTFLSVISIWESIIKYQIGKLPLPEPPEKYLPKQRTLHQISKQSLDESSVQILGLLPPIHKDPFDRMIVCQAISHQLILISSDHIFQSYSVPVLSVSR